VAYGDVDRDNLLGLPAVFKFLQEAAIKHADQFDAGTRAMTTRGESWVLNRMAAAIHRYPRYEETRPHPNLVQRNPRLQGLPRFSRLLR